MQKDTYHSLVRNALEQEGWRITHDPYFIRMGRRKGFIDLGAELLGAERGAERIAVEIKSFTSVSGITGFEDALGQFMLYKFALAQKEPERMLFLAIPRDYYEDFFDDQFFQQVLHAYEIRLIIYSISQSAIYQWIR